MSSPYAEPLVILMRELNSLYTGCSKMAFNNRLGNELMKRPIIIAAISALVAIMVLTVTAGPMTAAMMSSPGAVVPPGWSSHVPIIIVNDADFATQAAAPGSGWTGSGTSADPYILSGFDIDAGGLPAAVSISNVLTTFFTISNVYAHGALPSGTVEVIDGAGFWFNNVQNGRVVNSFADSNDIGILLRASTLNVVQSNDFTVNGVAGIYLLNSTSNTIGGSSPDQRNWCGNNYVGIWLELSDSNQVSGNDANGTDAAGISVLSSQSNTITNNVASDGLTNGIQLAMLDGSVVQSNGNLLGENDASRAGNFGISLLNSDSNTLNLNICSDDSVNGIMLDTSKLNTLSANAISFSLGDAIYLVDSDTNTLTSNAIAENYGNGIVLESTGLGTANSTLNEISGNIISDNVQTGVSILSSNSNTMASNTVTGNILYGVSLQGSTLNTVNRNYFSMNNGAQDGVFNAAYVQGLDDTGGNEFVVSGLGNIWKDAMPDNNGNGIRDIPYDLDGGVSSDTVALTAFLSPPQDLAASVTSPPSMNLTWNNSLIYNLGGPIDHIRVYRGLENGTGTLYNELAGSATSYTDVNVEQLGAYFYHVTAVNNRGESTFSNQVMVAVPDMTPPTVHIDLPLPNSLIHQPNVLVTWTGNDTMTGIAFFEVRLDGSAWTNVSLATNHTFSDLVDGEHNVSVRATDGVGLMAMDNVTFSVDARAPAVTGHAPIGNNVSISALVSVTFSEVMNHSSVQFTGVTGSISWSGNVATLTPFAPLLYNHSYAVTVNGMDVVGNSLAPFNWTFKTTDFGSITGVVKDQNGNLVSGAEVKLRSSGALVANVTTGSDGRFTINAPAGAYELTISKAGMLEKTVSATISPGQPEDLGDQALQPDNTLVYVAIVVVIVIGAAALAVWMSRRRK